MWEWNPCSPAVDLCLKGMRVYHAIADFEEGVRSDDMFAFFLEVLPPLGDSPSPDEAELVGRVQELVQERDGALDDLPEKLKELARQMLLNENQERDEWVACIADGRTGTDSLLGEPKIFAAPCNGSHTTSCTKKPCARKAMTSKDLVWSIAAKAVGKGLMPPLNT